MTAVKLIHAPTDPVCTRVSLGGSEELGIYCVYRGDLSKARAVLEAALWALREAEARKIHIPIDRNYKELGAS